MEMWLALSSAPTGYTRIHIHKNPMKSLSRVAGAARAAAAAAAAATTDDGLLDAIWWLRVGALYFIYSIQYTYIIYTKYQHLCHESCTHERAHAILLLMRAAESARARAQAQGTPLPLRSFEASR